MQERGKKDERDEAFRKSRRTNAPSARFFPLQTLLALKSPITDITAYTVRDFKHKVILVSEGIDGGGVEILVLVAPRRLISRQSSARSKSFPDPEHSEELQGRKRGKSGVLWRQGQALSLGCQRMHNMLSEPGHPTE